jgi:tetratricopeptide (TPR) repeat protein
VSSNHVSPDARQEGQAEQDDHAAASGMAVVDQPAGDVRGSDQGTSITAEKFSAAEAAGFLIGRTGLADEAGAAAVAEELGYLPLALALAGAVIARQQPGYREYLDRLHAVSAGQDPIPDEGQPYPRKVAGAVLLSIEAARAGDPAGGCGGVLEVMAVLSGTGVRRDLLHAAGQAGALAGGRRMAAATVDQAVDRLAGWSLVSVSVEGQTITEHHLVTRVVRDGLARRQRLAAVCRAAAAVLETRAQALAASSDREAARDIPRQVAALAEAAAGQADNQLAAMLLRLRFLALYHLIEFGDSAQAIAVGEPLAADLERLLGAGHPDTLNAQNSLAAAYQAAGRVDEAIPLFQQTLVGRQRLLGPHHPDALNSQNNLAVACQDAGRTAEAILLFEMTLAAREGLLGPGHPSTLNSRSNLARAYQDAGRAAEAIPLLEQTSAGRERVLGPDHADTVTSRNNLARAYRDAGRPAEAIPPPEQTSAVDNRPLAGTTEEVSDASRVQEPLPLDLQHPIPDPDQSPRPDPVQESPAAAAGRSSDQNMSREPEAGPEPDAGPEPEAALEPEAGPEPEAGRHPEPTVPWLGPTAPWLEPAVPW